MSGKPVKESITEKELQDELQRELVRLTETKYDMRIKIERFVDKCEELEKKYEFPEQKNIFHILSGMDLPNIIEESKKQAISLPIGIVLENRRDSFNADFIRGIFACLQVCYPNAINAKDANNKMPKDYYSQNKSMAEIMDAGMGSYNMVAKSNNMNLPIFGM